MKNYSSLFILILIKLVKEIYNIIIIKKSNNKLKKLTKLEEKLVN